MLPVQRIRVLGFSPSDDYIRFAEFGIKHLEPWKWLDGDRFDFRLSGLRHRYPSRNLLPFAERQDCDDVACWEGFNSDRVVIIHDYAEAGWESKASFVSWREWLHQALDDCLDFT
jgi:hypothetical protein